MAKAKAIRHDDGKFAKGTPAPAHAFKKGHVPSWTRPIGSEYDDERGMRRKVASHGKWAYVYVLNWVEAHGPIPPGMKLVCLGDRKNPSVDNYMLAPGGAVSGINRRWPGGLSTAPPDLRRAIVAAAIAEYQLGPSGNLPPDGLPATRKEALAIGVTYYFSGKTCPNGHRARRYTNSHECTQCTQEYRARPDVRERRNKAQNALRMKKRKSRPDTSTGRSH